MTPSFIPGLCSVTFRKLSPAEVAVLAVGAGVAAVEWGGDLHVPQGNLAAAREVRRLTEGSGLVVSSYGSYLAPPTDGLAAFRPVLATALALGARHIRIWPGTRGRDSADYSEAERAEAAGLIREMGRLAGAEGVTIGLECHPQSLTDYCPSAASLMAAIGQPDTYLYWQPRPGMPVEEALAEIPVLGPEICHLHVFAWDAAKTRYPLADQRAQWRRMMDAIPAGRWTGERYAMIEFVRDDDPAQFARDVTVLRELCAGR